MPNVTIAQLSAHMQRVLRRDPVAQAVEQFAADVHDPVQRTTNGVPDEMFQNAIAIDPARPSAPRETSGHALMMRERAQQTADYQRMAATIRESLSRDMAVFAPPLWYDNPSHAVVTRTRPPAAAPTSTTTIGEPAAVDADYAALVAELGVNSAAVDLETFKALVPQLGLRVYQRAEVQEYLHALYKVPAGDLTPLVIWGWRPLRKADQEKGQLVQFNGRIQRSAPLYAKPIPYPVLLTVKAVVDACPSARCFVSDELQGEKIPDPFLLVVLAGEEFVIERWDEPSFRAKA